MVVSHFFATMGLSDSLTGRAMVIHSHTALPFGTCRVSQVPRRFFRHAPSLLPRGVRQVSPLPDLSMAGFVTTQRLATPDLYNEATTGFTCIMARIFVSRGFIYQITPRRCSLDYLFERVINRMGTFQPTRIASLILAHRFLHRHQT